MSEKPIEQETDNPLVDAEGEADPPAMTSRQPMARSVEVLVVILLSLATVTTAWSAYQATRWSGEQAINAGRADSLRAEAGRESNTANSAVIVDVQLFLAWVVAASEGDETRADYLEERFRDEFVPAYEAWRASAPEGTVPDGTPFELPEYASENSAAAETDRLTAEAEARVADSREANQRGDNFILVTVLFAMVLFFAGTVGKVRSMRVRRTLLAIAGVVWVVGVVVMLAMPQNIGF